MVHYTIALSDCRAGIRLPYETHIGEHSECWYDTLQALRMEQANNNYAFIDGQNLYLSTKANGWTLDMKRFRVYLKEKYKVSEAYYFLGYLREELQDLYSMLQRAGFIIIFREHHSGMLGNKKGNIDTDLVFEVMRNLVDETSFGNVVLVSGDGDYKKMVDYLIKKDRFEKILFPNRKFASSLYKQLGNQYFVHLDNRDVRPLIART
ncbi:MAG: NYN domain-containing protein [Bacteroidota bacterium]